MSFWRTLGLFAVVTACGTFTTPVVDDKVGGETDVPNRDDTDGSSEDTDDTDVLWDTDPGGGGNNGGLNGNGSPNNGTTNSGGATNGTTNNGGLNGGLTNGSNNGGGFDTGFDSGGWGGFDSFGFDTSGFGDTGLFIPIDTTF